MGQVSLNLGRPVNSNLCLCCENITYAKQIPEGVSWAYLVEVQSNTMEKAWRQEREVAGHITLREGRRERGTLGLSSLSPFHLVQGTSTWDGAAHM